VTGFTLRADIATAQDAYTSAARLYGWGVLYLALGLRWWPAALIAAATVGVAWAKSRSGTDILADLVETTADLYLSLARQLGITCDGPLAPDVGETITARLRKDSAAQRISR